MAVHPLQAVDFIGTDGKHTSGLVPVRDIPKKDLNALATDERVAISYAEKLVRIDYVFFRRFSDGRSSQIAAYVVNNSDQRLDDSALAELHKNVWLHGAAPLLYIAWPSRIDILSCARGPDFLKADGKESHYNPTPLETASGITDELKRFSALRLADGTFWEDPSNAKLADHTKAAHQSLIQAVVDTDTELDGENNLALRRLLLLVVLIKYLEDRGVFPNAGWFGTYRKGARSFFDVLSGGEPDEVYKFLGALEKKFNGGIFTFPETGGQRFTKQNLLDFAVLVEGKTLKGQRNFWKLFSFEHLPVEVISNLYQRFVQDGHGAVYTPPFLATLLLDAAMPYSKLTGKERVLDPSCGSGVFLVGAFRRLINFWRTQNDWQRPDVSTLKDLLRRSIYGIELDPNAVQLTSFSLNLAICDALQPEVIWKELRFDPLHKTNLLEADFFQVLLDSRKGDPTIIEDGFDIVVGNPPFESNLSPAATSINNKAENQNRARGALPDKQVAYLFLEQALSVLRPDGSVCLIQPHGLLYNSNVQAFRTAIFQKHKVETIFDFISIRKLYDGADPKTIAMLANAVPPPDNHWVNHRTFRRTVSVLERICFEIDHYDHHRVSQIEAETDPYVWKVNLLGGGRLLEISKRFRNMRTLAQYLSMQKKWDYGEGFIAARTGRRTTASFLSGKPCLSTGSFTDDGIDEDKIETVGETHFRSAYTKSRYSSPLILIKEQDSLPVVFWDKGFIAYRAKIVGIHAPRSRASDLRELYENIRRNHDIYRYSCTLNGTQSLVGKATSILKQDIDALPYPDDMKDFTFSFWEEALQEDVLKYMAEYVRLGQNSDLLGKEANAVNLNDYSYMFIKLLGSVYDNLKAADPIVLDGLICQPFYFGEQPNLSWFAEGRREYLRKLIYKEEHHRRLRTIRVFRYYSGNVILLVKPDRLRYWIRSTAIRDADETLFDLRQQGY